MNTVIFLDYDMEADIQFPGAEVYPVGDAPLTLDDSIARTVLVSRLTYGLQGYHINLFQRCSHVSEWIIAAVDVQSEAVIEQCRSISQGIFNSTGAALRIIQDTPALKGLYTALSAHTHDKRVLMLLPGDVGLAERVQALFQERLLNWEIEIGPDSVHADTVNAVMYAGSTDSRSDLYSAPPSAALKLLWFDTCNPVTSPEKERMVRQALEVFNGIGWELIDEDCIIFSSLSHEDAALRLSCGKISHTALMTDRDFVIWDQYGLPLRHCEYSAESINLFLSGHTYFSDLIKRLSLL